MHVLFKIRHCSLVTHKSSDLSRTYWRAIISLVFSVGFTNCFYLHLLTSELRRCCCLPLQLKKLFFHPSPLYGRGEPGRARAGQVARLIWKGTSLIPTIRKRQLPASQGQSSLIRVEKQEEEEDTSLFWRRDITTTPRCPPLEKPPRQEHHHKEKA